MGLREKTKDFVGMEKMKTKLNFASWGWRRRDTAKDEETSFLYVCGLYGMASGGLVSGQSLLWQMRS